MFSFLLNLAEAGRLPDVLVRQGIRNLLKKRLQELNGKSCEVRQDEFRNFLATCANAPVAIQQDKANEQHYEVPSAFFHLFLGPHLKYSCCVWNEGVTSLGMAEQAALETTCLRAELQDGQSILELGCGWGSLSLWMAKQYPNATITAVSNSNSQREFIVAQARERKLTNLKVITADMNSFSPQRSFDRVVSIEMFEHMRNQSELIRRISTWLNDSGKLFVHLFCHREQPYFYEDNGPEDWMTRYFFSGGMMPSDHLLTHFQSDLKLVNHWRWNGVHYEKTCNAWLKNLDAQRELAMQLMISTYGDKDAGMWFQRWRMFVMACAELFGYHQGNEWWVSHYLFQKQHPR